MQEPSLIQYSDFQDERGVFSSLFKSNDESFVRVWKNREVKQVNTSFNKNIGLIRGMHYQKHPYQEAKLITCTAGRVIDIVIDMRKDSINFLKWYKFDLSKSNNSSLFIPEGFAHGFQVLEENTILLYLHSEIWKKSSELGIRWNDPLIGIEWPLQPTMISKRDRSFSSITK